MLDRNRAYIITTLSSLDLSLMLKYGLATNKMLADAKQNLLAKPSLSGMGAASVEQKTQAKKQKKKQSKSRREQIGKAIRVAPGKGADLSDLKLIWVYSRIDLIWGGMDVDTYLLFKDGSVYKECAIPPDELNVEASKRLEPDKWSTWRKRWGTYQVKNKDKDKWIDLKGGPAGKAPQGADLEGVYVNAGGSQFKGSWKKHIRFNDNGRFDMSSFSIQSNSEMGGGDVGPLVTVVGSSDKHGSSASTSVIGANVGGGGSTRKKDGAKNTGTYEVNGYTMTLVHDNGWRHTELFLYEDRGDAKSIVYGKDLYFLDD
jgi:hypothetical protein